jgi:uncharacterized protein (TIGR02996 family)
MSNHQSFLDTIAAQPADRSLRLIYADWLEERGDLGGELIRIEEEMRRVPVWADRFWELKPRRNELRKRVDSALRKKLGYGLDVPPTFAHGIPDGWRERWRLIREFTERWSRRPMADVGGRQQKIRAVEKRLRRTLVPAIQEWVAFAHDVNQRQYEGRICVLRDILQMTDLPGHDALSLMLQCEGDLHWAVLHEDLHLPDPPVWLFREFGGENEFVQDQQSADRITSFALNYTMAGNNGLGGGFGTHLVATDELLQQLNDSFPVQWCPGGEIIIYEAENILVELGPTWRPPYRSFRVEVARKLPRKRIPAFFWEHTTRGGSFHGMFAPHDNR